MKFNKLTFILAAFFLFLCLPFKVYAGTIYSISGDNKEVGDVLTIVVTHTGSCDYYSASIDSFQELKLENWGGVLSTPVDFSEAQISATVNGISAIGSRKHIVHNSKKQQELYLTLDQPHNFNADTTKIEVTVTNARRVGKTDVAYLLSLLTVPTDVQPHTSVCRTHGSVLSREFGRNGELIRSGPMPQVTIVGSKPTAVPSIVTPTQLPTSTPTNPMPTPTHVPNMVSPTITEAPSLPNSPDQNELTPSSLRSTIQNLYKSLSEKFRSLFEI